MDNRSFAALLEEKVPKNGQNEWKMREILMFWGGQKQGYFQQKPIFVFLGQPEDGYVANLVSIELLWDIDSETQNNSTCIALWNELEWQKVRGCFCEYGIFDVKSAILWIMTAQYSLDA